jgi:hypothetical protein
MAERDVLLAENAALIAQLNGADMLVEKLKLQIARLKRNWTIWRRLLVNLRLPLFPLPQLKAHYPNQRASQPVARCLTICRVRAWNMRLLWLTPMMALVVARHVVPRCAKWVRMSPRSWNTSLKAGR